MALALNPVPRRFSKALLYFRFSEEGGPPEVEQFQWLELAQPLPVGHVLVQLLMPQAGDRPAT